MLLAFTTVTQQVLVLFILLLIGFVLGKCKLIDQRGSLTMSNLVMYVVTPCMLISAFQRPFVAADFRNFLIVAVLSIVFIALSVVISMLLIRDGDEHRRRTLQFSVQFTNCGFMGYPLMLALLGSIGVFYGSAYVAMFNVLGWTWGVYALTGDRRQLRLRPLLLNPGILGVAIALVFYLLGITLPQLVLRPVEYMAALNTPLPMMVVGYQLSHADFRKAFSGRSAWMALALSLVVVPLLTVGVLYFLPLDASAAIVLVIAMSTPPAALLSMFSQKFALDTDLASSVVSVFTALSVLTMPPVIALAQYLF